VLQAQGFGFVVLYNGPQSRGLKGLADARQKGSKDAETATKTAEREGFPSGTILFLDIEEGGRLADAYQEYLQAWFDGMSRAGYRSGVYCSAMPVSEGPGVSITTVQDIQAHARSREIVFWVFNDACPPSPGCIFPASAPSPSRSGFSQAAVWQYVRSPRTKEVTRQCSATYAADGNCYAPGDVGHKWFLDVNAAPTPDPSAAK
jgi:hypothetical protein